MCQLHFLHEYFHSGIKTSILVKLLGSCCSYLRDVIFPKDPSTEFLWFKCDAKRQKRKKKLLSPSSAFASKWNSYIPCHFNSYLCLKAVHTGWCFLQRKTRRFSGAFLSNFSPVLSLSCDCRSVRRIRWACGRSARKYSEKIKLCQTFFCVFCCVFGNLIT